MHKVRTEPKEPIEGKKTRSKFAGKIARAKKARYVLGSLLGSGIITVSVLSAKGQTAGAPAQLPADQKFMTEVASAGNKLARPSTYVVPSTSDTTARRPADKKVGSGPDPKKPRLTQDGYEILDNMIPSAIMPDVGTNTITMRHFAFIDVEGNVIRGDGSSEQINLSESQWKSLGADKFDGREIEIVLKSKEYGYVHYLLHPDWRGMLQIMEPKFVDRKCGAINIDIVEPESELSKPLVYWSDSLSILVAERTGLVGEIRGQEGELNLTNAVLFIKNVVKPSFIKATMEGRNVVIFDPADANRKKLCFYLDENGLITGEMKPID